MERELDRSAPRVLYVAYWGAAEPLGRSLIVPAVKRLASHGASLTLVTFEKPADWERSSEIGALRATLEADGIRWMPCLYHKRPKVPATAFDVARGILQGLLARGSGRFDIVHARTFVGGLMGLVLARALGAKLVYHNEGFYPDEQVDGGVWREGSLPHRSARALERRLYETSDGIVVLSHRAKQVVEQMPAVRRRSTPVAVVPSCVDLEAFSLPPTPPNRRGPLRFVYIGSIGARYMLDELAHFVRVAREELGGAELDVFTREDPKWVRDGLERAGLPSDSISVRFVSHSEIPRELAKRHVGLMFLRGGLSPHGCSPTKIGEYWACGLPVVSSAGISDTDEIIRRERVGAIVSEYGDDAYRRVVRQLAALLEDEGLPARCRAAAERHYDLASGCTRQLELYSSILGRSRAAEPAAVAS